MDIKISVVIPTYKRPALLMKCLQTLVGQTFDKQDYEIIVVSDGPDKETQQVIEQWSSGVYPVIRYIPLPEKRGPAAARNTGWQQAAADLIAFTDDDCQADPSWLSMLWKMYDNHKPTLQAYTGRIIVPVSSRPTDYEKNILKLEKAEFVTANCGCTKQALQHVGGFDEQFSMAWREDSDLHFKFIQYGIPIHHLPNAIVVHPVRQAPWGISIKEQKKSMYNALLYKKYPQLYREKIQPTPPWHYYMIVLSFLLCCLGAFYGKPVLTISALISWAVLTIWFIAKRLSATSRTLHHILEIALTSLIIPFLSLFWRFYGSWKYKTLLI